MRSLRTTVLVADPPATIYRPRRRPLPAASSRPPAFRLWEAPAAPGPETKSPGGFGAPGNMAVSQEPEPGAVFLLVAACSRLRRCASASTPEYRKAARRQRQWRLATPLSRLLLKLPNLLHRGPPEFPGPFASGSTESLRRTFFASWPLTPHWP